MPNGDVNFKSRVKEAELLKIFCIYHLIITTVNYLSLVMNTVYNISLCAGIVPAEWKLVNIIPIFKKGLTACARTIFSLTTTVKPTVWMRYTDNLFTTFDHSQDELDVFLEALNSFHQP